MKGIDVANCTQQLTSKEVVSIRIYISKYRICTGPRERSRRYFSKAFCVSPTTESWENFQIVTSSVAWQFAQCILIHLSLLKSQNIEHKDDQDTYRCKLTPEQRSSAFVWKPIFTFCRSANVNLWRDYLSYLFKVMWQIALLDKCTQSARLHITTRTPSFTKAAPHNQSFDSC